MTSPTRKKGAGIVFSLPGTVGDGDAAEAGPGAGRPAARTGVGLLSQTMFEGQRLEQQNAELREQVEQLKGERGAQPMDPHSVVPSRWANRHPDSFSDDEFQDLKREIADAGGNVQPIKVRPIREHVEGQGARYEIVFGHRRHRACLELGLPVRAVVEELDDPALFVQMERENRDRQNLSAWEQGRMYLRALDEGLFASNTKLAAAIGRDVSDVGKATRIAKLPQEITTAFASPNAIKFQWASDLERALREHPVATLAAARALGARTPRAVASEVFRTLTASLRGEGVGSSHPPRTVDLGEGRSVVIRADAKGKTLVQFPAGVLPAARWDALEASIRKLVG